MRKNVFSVAGDDPRGLRRSITGYSDDIYICLSMYKCLFDGCIPPPPEDDRPPSMEREDGCRRYDEFEWMVNPNNPQEVLSLIDQDEGKKKHSLKHLYKRVFKRVCLQRLFIHFFLHYIVWASKL